MSSRSYMIDTRLGSSANYFVVLDDEGGCKVPKLQFKMDGPAVPLRAETSLAEIEKQMRLMNMVNSAVEFYSPDGSRYAKSCDVTEISRFPFFRIRVNNGKEYHVHNKQAFKSQLPSVDQDERDFEQFVGDNYNISSRKARQNGKLINELIQKLETAPEKATFTHEDISRMLKDALAKNCVTINSERQSLIQQLELIEESLKPLYKTVENSKEMGHLKAQRAGFTFVSIIMLQFALSQYGTYIAFSWDIMEPITACVALSDAIAGYFFWLIVGKPWDVDSFRNYFYEREMNKRLHKLRINQKDFENLKASKQQILDRLMKEY